MSEILKFCFIFIVVLFSVGVLTAGIGILLLSVEAKRQTKLYINSIKNGVDRV